MSDKVGLPQDGFSHSLLIILYTHNGPKLSDGQAFAKSADPDQTVPRGAV